MADFLFEYQRRQSLETQLSIARPFVSVALQRRSDPTETAFCGRFRMDTGSDYSTAPLHVAAEILGLGDGGQVPDRREILREVVDEMREQGLRPISLAPAAGSKVLAYPLWVSAIVVDDRGDFGQLKSLFAFVDAPSCKLLIGIGGLLDRFDVRLNATHFSWIARPGAGVACASAGLPRSDQD